MFCTAAGVWLQGATHLKWRQLVRSDRAISHAMLWKGKLTAKKRKKKEVDSRQSAHTHKQTHSTKSRQTHKINISLRLPCSSKATRLHLNVSPPCERKQTATDLELWKCNVMQHYSISHWSFIHNFLSSPLPPTAQHELEIPCVTLFEATMSKAFVDKSVW